MKYDLELIKIAQDICKDLREAGATTVMVAGGYPSNMLLERPINDIDVFYEGDITCPYEEIKLPKPKPKSFWNLFQNNANGAEENAQYELDLDSAYPENEEWNVTHFKCKKEGVLFPIQLIKVKSVETHLDTFGAGIRKVAITEYGVFMTTEFLKNVELQTISFSVDKECKFAKKIMDQFPEYSYE